MPAKQGILKCLLIKKNKYGCQICSKYTYYYWAQSLLAFFFISITCTLLLVMKECILHCKYYTYIENGNGILKYLILSTYCVF